jgi:hypothetical protein
MTRSAPRSAQIRSLPPPNTTPLPAKARITTTIDAVTVTPALIWPRSQVTVLPAR